MSSVKKAQLFISFRCPVGQKFVILTISFEAPPEIGAMYTCAIGMC